MPLADPEVSLVEAIMASANLEGEGGLGALVHGLWWGVRGVKPS